MISGGITPSDIYADIRYAGCYAYTGESARVYRFETTDGFVEYVFAMRPSVLPGRVDIVTPYGYGGPRATCREPGRRAALIRAFSEDFSAYCRAEGVVSEFIRFHPLLGNAADFAEYCRVEFNRHTVAIPLGEPAYSLRTLPSKCRNMVSKAIRAGVTVHALDAASDWRAFHALYRRDMIRLAAPEFYHFPEELFEAKRTRLGGEIALYGAFLGDVLIAGAMILRGGEFRHYHLASGSDASRASGASNLLIHAIAEAEAAKGAKWLHLGGGRTVDPHDSLFAFKRSFTDATELDFCIGKRIRDEAAYREACALAGVDPVRGEDAERFPEYGGR